MPVIEVRNITKRYRRHREIRMLVGRGGLFGKMRGREPDLITALDDVSLSVDAGECVGLIGANGSGKSTLLKIISRVTLPTSGHIRVEGRVASLLELGAGFHPLLTGRENTYLNGSILGMRRRDVDRVFDSVVEFSGIAAFIDEPVQTYSSGMFVRLAFSVAIHSNPDIFLIDEVLSVGDEEFQRKCRTRLNELKEDKKTLIFVSHDLGVVSALADRCLLLSKGTLQSRGSPQATIDYYVRQVGAETGVHNFKEGDLEGIFCHGRVSLFHKGVEVTVQQGFNVEVMYLNNWFNACSGDWLVHERRDNGCRVTGRMHKLPIDYHWDLEIKDGRFRWKVAIECRQEFSLEEFEINLFVPTHYDEWTYEDMEGTFPEILPTDRAWVLVMAPEFTGKEGSAIATAESELPPLYVTLHEHRPFLRLRWQNTDYAFGSRVLQVWGRFPRSELPLKKELYEVVDFSIDLGLSPADAHQRARDLDAHNAVHTDVCSARFDNGRVHLFAGEDELTALVFLHTSVLIDALWTDSHHLLCGRPERSGSCIRMTAESQRYPFHQEFELEAVPGGIAFRVWLVASEDLEVSGYHTSIGLRTEYNRWESAAGSGLFPDSGEPTIACGTTESGNTRLFVRALSDSLPSVTLEVDVSEIPAQMNVKNTGAKVIEARCRSEEDLIRFPKGRHLFFSGIVAVGEASPGRAPVKKMT